MLLRKVSADHRKFGAICTMKFQQKFLVTLKVIFFNYLNQYFSLLLLFHSILESKGLNSVTHINYDSNK